MELKELIAWQQAREFRNDESYRLKDQILRSSRSISVKLAEGYGRFHYQENIQFCKQARGSLVETFDHLTAAPDEKYIDDDSFVRLVELHDELKRIKNGYIKFLQTRKNEG